MRFRKDVRGRNHEDPAVYGSTFGSFGCFIVLRLSYLSAMCMRKHRLSVGGSGLKNFVVWALGLGAFFSV